MLELTPEQREELLRAGEQPIPLTDHGLPTDFLIIRADVLQRLRNVEVIDPSFFEFEEPPAQSCPEPLLSRC